MYGQDQRTPPPSAPSPGHGVSPGEERGNASHVPSSGWHSTQGESRRGQGAHPLTQRVEAKQQDQQAQNTRARQSSPSSLTGQRLLAKEASGEGQRLPPGPGPAQRAVASHQEERLLIPPPVPKTGTALPRELPVYGTEGGKVKGTLKNKSFSWVAIKEIAGSSMRTTAQRPGKSLPEGVGVGGER